MTVDGNVCRDDCTVCGDGVLDPGEECDDGNTAGGDRCRPDCTDTCGDAILDLGHFPSPPKPRLLGQLADLHGEAHRRQCLEALAQLPDLFDQVGVYLFGVLLCALQQLFLIDIIRFLRVADSSFSVDR